MNLLDLYETREPYQQAIDRLEARRIEDLNDKMDDLIARARAAKTPEHKAGLTREFQKCKDERDGYYKIKEQQDPSNTPPANRGIGDVQDPKQKMDQLKQQGKQGPLANIGAGLRAFFTGKQEPMDEEEQVISPRALGVANFQRLLKANMGNIPTVTLEFIKPEDNIKLDKNAIDLISDYYDALEGDSQKNYFIYRVLPSADETVTVLRNLGWQPQSQQDLPGIPTQGELPLQEKKKFSNNEPIKSADVKVARELQKLRAQYPAAGSDLEAVARAEIDGAERSQRQLAAIRGANDKQDALLKQLVDLDQEQGREIDNLDQENDTLEKRLAQVQATDAQLQQAVDTIAGNRKNTVKTNKIDKTDAKVGGIIDVGPTGVSTPAASGSVDQPAPQPIKQQPTTGASTAIGNVTRQIQRFNQPAPSIRMAANDDQQKIAAEAVDNDKQGVAETALNPNNPKDDYEAKRRALHDLSLNKEVDQAAVQQRRLDLDKEAKAKGIAEEVNKAGALKAAQAAAKFMLRNLDDRAALKDYSMHFWSPTKFYQGATMAMRGVGFDEIVKHISQDQPAQFEEGWSDAYVSRRTGRPRTPYSVYIKGKKWKDFENDDRARAVMDKLKAKFKADGRDPETITIAPTDMSEGLIKEPTNEKEYLDQRDKLFRMMDLEKDSASKQIIRQAIQDLEARYGNLKNTVKEAEGIPAKMVMQSFVVEYNSATKIVTISKRNQELDRFQFKGVPSLGSFQRTVNTRIKNLEDDLYGDSNEAGAVSLSRVKIPGRGYGYQDLGEESTTSSEAVEIAIIKRILIAHTDLIMEFGLDKVTQAIEEVAYNVGDVDEIGTSDVSAYVHQVKQILGVPEELDEKWSAKYKSSINCANPKGFSQRAHCAGKKK